MNWFVPYIDVITFVIAVVGFIISIYNFVVSILQRRTRFRIEIPHVFRFENPKKCVDTINLKIYNLSATPVVLSRITISNKSSCGSFGSYRREIFSCKEMQNRQIISSSIWMSDFLPIKIEGKGFVNLLLVSDDQQPIFELGAVNTIHVYTPNKMRKEKFFLSDFTAKELLEECREPSYQ